MSYTLIKTSLVGLEDVQRAAFYVFFEGMNNALDEIENYWTERDVIFDQMTGKDISPSLLERITPENFHEGHKPSLINGNPDRYPNVAVFATQAGPSPQDQGLDHEDSWLDTLIVEVMVKAPALNLNDMSGDNEVLCNRRIQRTTEAAVLCLRRNPSLGGAMDGYTAAPQIIISDLFAMRSPSQGGAYSGEIPAGSRYVWQGSQITFRIQKESTPPSSGPGTFAEASQVDYSANIDQG
jgi:hypothetical protein